MQHWWPAEVDLALTALNIFDMAIRRCNRVPNALTMLNMRVVPGWD
ncbi:hypothetical protein THTE_3747 [Thermogutta terrifontis]|uniref:Uncharacterized protein n=1 Tax=Thermogutta terrifontis TaxID=1331910 RepID=A0A286RK66_9BACT|nr:hypothetical protein THTE_3747 [Thermogutta terrifontis]